MVAGVQPKATTALEETNVIEQLSEEQKRRMYQMHLEGYSLAEIAETFNRSKQRVWSILRSGKLGPYMPRGRPRERRCPDCGNRYRWNGASGNKCPRCRRRRRVCIDCGQPCSQAARRCMRCDMLRRRRMKKSKAG